MPDLTPEQEAAALKAKQEADLKANAHDEATAELHAEAKRRGVTPAWLSQQPEWQNKIAKEPTE